MPLLPGNDTVTFITEEIVADRLHHLTAQAPTSVVVNGCAFQPMSVSDKIADTAMSDASHKCISPANDTTLACTSESKVSFFGVTFRVVGVKRYRDKWGRPTEVAIYCKEQHG